MIFGMFAALLGAGVLMALIDTDDDQSTDAEDELSGETLIYNGDATITGSEGNDTLSGADIENLSPEELDLVDQTEEIDLLGGDDTAEVNTEVTVYGGEGNDILTATSVGNTLHGEQGDDTLVGIAANDLYGGEGNDLISIDLTAELNDRSSTADGGEGDDRLEVTSEIGDEFPDYSSVNLVGGDGNDEFHVTLELVPTNFFNGTETASIVSHPGVRIADFEPGEDSLTIEIERSPETEGRDMTSAELVPVEYTYNGEVISYTNLVMTFAGSESDPEVVSSIRLDGALSLTLDDIAFIQS